MRSSLTRWLAGGLALGFWISLGAVAAFGWYATARGLAVSWGLGDAATAFGLLAGAVVSVTMWRWARAEGEAAALAEGRCPRCSAPVEPLHEHARADRSVPGLTSWTCTACEYERTQPLTCPACAA